MGEDRDWGLSTEASRDEARNECFVEENLSPSTQNVVVWENEKSLEANTIRLGTEAKPFGRKGIP